MAARTVRKQLNHGDIDERKNESTGKSESDALREPLLGEHDNEESYTEVRDGCRGQQDFWDDKKEGCLQWAYHVSHFIAQSAKRIANIFSGFGSFLWRILCHSSISQNRHNEQKFPIHLSPLQNNFFKIECVNIFLITLVAVLLIFFGLSGLVGRKIKKFKAEDALKQLWRLAYPNREIPPLKSDLWKEMGWQGSDPSTDFRGGGFISLENLIYFAENYQDSFHRLLHKQNGTRAAWEYPFAIAGINISYTLVQMLELQSDKPTSRAGARFLELLGEDEMAFDNLYCVAFQMLDAQWLARRATYMEFNEVLKSTRTQLEQELVLEDISSIQDLTAYKTLNR
ncbi:ELMO domain-containing protein A [Cocos nucifera]|uniref:ELMO domain-containing protein A n=1 Tax=Cocos nucifera TaxID=13894 RepID=A0A8K0I5K3_COCNU|nr:ELMO domain-containing protein A [Cocos nucifera]